MLPFSEIYFPTTDVLISVYAHAYHLYVYISPINRISKIYGNFFFVSNWFLIDTRTDALTSSDAVRSQFP